MAGKERSIEIVDAVGNRVILLDGDVGVQGPDGSIFGGGVPITWPLLASSVDTYVWRCESGVYEVASVNAILSVTGGTSAAVDVKVCTGVVAPASGTTQLDAPLDLEQTAPAQVLGAVIAVPTKIYPGNSVALDFSGTLTGLVGMLTINLRKVG